VPAIGITRSNVHPVLTGALEEGVIQMGVECTGFDQDSEGVTARLAEGGEERGDVLIGADGIYSLTRLLERGQDALRFAGYALTFGIVEVDHELLEMNRFREFAGAGARFIHFPVGEGRTYWSAIYVSPQGETEGYRASKSEVLDIYKGWPEPIGQLLEATDESAMFRRDIFDRKPVKRWGSGRVTLVGDAAHPMTPNLGQGACQAIEDAVVLAKHLQAEGDVVAALRAYEQRRMKRTAGFVNRSWMIGSMGRWKRQPAIWIRNQVQRAVFPTVALRAQKKAMAYRF
jgi:2-polyprenyl-6-methoxyphenol hydroxylase-like FAD-dependent oxidoreductase